MKPFYTLGVLILSLSSYAQTPVINSTYGVTGLCTSVVYGNGVYVASAGLTSDLNAVFTSTDAKTWTPLPSGHFPTQGFSLMAFGNGVFVGLAFPATMYSSTDGASWTLVSSDISAVINDLKFIQGAFYAVGSGGTIVKSTDGINWAPFSLGITVSTDNNLVNIDYGGGQFAIASSIPATRGTPEYTGVYRSATGTPGSWTLSYLDGSTPLTKMIWLKDRFYLFASGSFVTSTDAIVWAAPAPPLVDTLTDGTIGTLSELDAPAAFTAGDSVYLMGSNSGNGTYSMQVSVDGTHFNGFYSSGMVAVGGLYVNGLYIIYGGGGIATSTDGVHFRVNSTSFSGLASNGSGFVAVGGGGSGGHMFSSPDFVNWTDRTPQTGGLPNLSTLLYTGTKYVAGGGGGNIYFSDDGASWSNIQTPYSFLSMAYGAGRFVAGAYDDGTDMLTSSTDGINWTVVDTNYTYYYNVRYINNNFFALGISYRDLTGRIMQSADGLHWNNISPAAGFTVFQYGDVMYDGTKYYFTGVKKGPDGWYSDFFTLSTTNPMDTTSYGAAGTIVNPAPGTSVGDYIAQFGTFVYHNGQFVGTVEDRLNFQAYLLYSTDGMNWTSASLNGPEQPSAILVDGDTYRIVGADGGRYSVNFTGSPLPVTLFDFEAVAVASGAGESSQLSWRTGSESNSSYFLVQHSLDAVHWDSIGRVIAAGESAVTTSYQFTQAGPPAGANYYRLGMTDRDGRRQWSPVRQVDIGDEGDVRLFPNPAKGVVQLQLPGSGPASLVVYNSAGLPVRQQVVSGYSATLDLRSLTAGTYHLLVFQGGKRYNKEFIIAE